MSEKKHLHQRILAITEGMAGITKTGQAQTGGGRRYTYYTIDEIEAHLIPLMVEHGVMIYPTVKHVSRESVVVFQGGRDIPASLVQMSLEARFVNVDNPDESITLQGYGEGLDTSDKAPGKAWSYALRYLYLVAFHIRGQEDSEQESPQITQAPKPPEVKLMTPGQIDQIKGYGKTLHDLTGGEEEDTTLLDEAKRMLKAHKRVPYDDAELLIKQLVAQVAKRQDEAMEAIDTAKADEAEAAKADQDV